MTQAYDQPSFDAVPFESEITRRRAAWPARVAIQAVALVFCSVGLAVRRSLWLLTSLSFAPMRVLAPKLKCKLRANLVAALLGGAVVFLAHRWGPSLGPIRVATLLLLSSLYGAITVLAVQWPMNLDEAKRLNERWPVRWFAGCLKNPLDGAMVRQALQLGIATFPGMVGVLVPSLFSPASVVLFLIGAFATVMSGDNLVHVMVHNKPFTSSRHASRFERVVLGALHWYAVFFVLPACFHNYPFYLYQHNYNHHIENNSPHDTQTTLWYDRTSYLDFARYALGLATTLMTAYGVLVYFAQRQKMKLFRRLLGGMLAYYAVIGVLGIVNWRAALLFVVGRFCLHGVNQAGLGWYQHALFDPRDPTNDYTNSTNFAPPIEPFGAGLHGEHHVRMGRHWSAYQEAYKANPAYQGLISNELDPVPAHDFFALLFLREYRKVGQLYTRGRLQCSPEELEALVKERALPVVPRKRGAFAEAFDRAVTVAAVRVLMGRWAPR
jgi:hypothetical protein